MLSEEERREHLRQNSRRYRQRHLKRLRDEDRERSRLYRSKHPEKIKESASRYKATHRDQLAEYNRIWSIKNKSRRAASLRRFRKNNLECVLQRERDYFKEHREACLERAHKYYEKNSNRVRTYSKQYFSTHKPALNAKARLRYARSEHLRLRALLSSRIRKVLREAGAGKSKCTLELVGCSVEHLKNHLAKQLKPGMTWENRGAWEIDHRRPCASFDLTNPSEQLKCFHYTNLQPLWKEENRSKGSRWRGTRWLVKR